MIKSKLLKALALGLCMSALYTGAAFAETGGGSAPAYAGQTDPAFNALFEKQSEIDQYLFTDHADELKEKGISVVYTGVVDNYVEIGITPLNDANAKYLYDIFGDKEVKVVAGEQAALYTTGVAEPNVTVSTDVAKDAVADPAAGTSSDALPAKGAADGAGQEYSIQIETVDGQAAADTAPEYQTVSAPDGQGIADAKVVSAAEDNVAADTVKDTNSDSLSAPVIILIIAGGAVAVGGAVLATGKKKAIK